MIEVAVVYFHHGHFDRRRQDVDLSFVILAAGEGTRMKSDVPKMLHPLAGQPLITYAVEIAQTLTDVQPVLVVGRGAEAVQEAAGAGVVFVEQAERRGTGHAVLQAREALWGRSNLALVTYADMPLLTVETLRRLVERQRENAGPITMLALVSDEPRGFGRVIRDESGAVTQIVEEAVATPEQLAIRELNVGAYCFDAAWLWANVDHIPLSLPKREYYLTDTIGMAVEQGLRVEAVITKDSAEALGINTRVHLAEAERALRRRINERWMLAGVTLVDPATTYVEPGVTIGQDTTIQPNTHLRGETTIGERCVVGPNTIIVDCQIGDGCRVLASVLEQAVMEEDSDIGPFGHLRKGARLCKGAHVGNFGEMKNSTLGPGAKMGHFSYLGDAEVGVGVNIGAGTITCNYDGVRKNKTVIEEGAFIGSDTMLVAPVQVGKGARTAAGAVVTRDVPDGALACGMPARMRKQESGRTEEQRNKGEEEPVG
jgi:bifunctional UDP-N-acetylglucosamine pyrophosphorylase/glucosamine-1-phosphate N-acetyltransferase